jgi:hypothetical protein
VTLRYVMAGYQHGLDGNPSTLQQAPAAELGSFHSLAHFDLSTTLACAAAAEQYSEFCSEFVLNSLPRYNSSRAAMTLHEELANTRPTI